MNKEKLLELYEKLYFHEMEVRERITGRVQVTFALVATGYTILSYMLRMLDFTISKKATLIFSVSAVLTFTLSFVCLYYLVRAFWGNTYKGMPSPIEIDNYRESLVAHKKEIEAYNNSYPDNQQPKIDIDPYISEDLYQKFRECSAHNTEVNDRRSRQIHQAFKWLLFAAIPMLITSATFIAYDLDASSPRKETPIIDSSVATGVTGIINELEALNSSISQGVKLVSKNERTHVPVLPTTPQKSSVSPQVDNDQSLPNKGE